MSKKIENLKGQNFGKLLVLDEEPIRKNNITYWKCKCECGNKKYIYAGNLKNGSSKSCGCMPKRVKTGKEKDKDRQKILHTLSAMKQRCYNPNDKRYNRYGAKGIRVCEEWRKNSKSFYEWSMKNGYNYNLTIDRINPVGDYEPNNCRWATYKEQENNKTNNTLIKINNSIRTISQWADYYKVSYNHFRGKIQYNKNKGYCTLKNGTQVKFEIIK